MSRVVIVRCAELPKCPAAFQQYVADWFAPSSIMGIDVLKASILTFFDAYHQSFRGRHSGVAPGHTCDTARYMEGLLNGQNLNDWIRANYGKLVWSIHAVEDDMRGCIADGD